MKKSVLYLTIGLAFSIVSCSGNNSSEANAIDSVDKGQWTDEDITNAKNNAKFSADADPELKTAEQRAKFCDCWVIKVIEASPDPMKQGEIPIEKAAEFSEECRAEVLK